MAILNLDQRFPIVDPKTGQPTDYFMRMLRGVTGPVGDATTDIATLFARNLTAGSGLTGGGDLSADRTLNVGAGTGITVNADDVAIDTAAEAERIRDVIGSALVAGSNITITANDGADTITIAATGGGSSTWTLVNQSGAATTGTTWTWSANVANVDVTGLGSYNELLVIARGVSASVSGFRAINFSVDNGATFPSASGDYVIVNATGVEGATTGLSHSTATTAARSFDVQVPNTKAAVKLAITPVGRFYFVNSTSAINALRLYNINGGNLTAGSLYVYAR